MMYVTFFLPHLLIASLLIILEPECLDFSRASDDYIRLPERPPWDYSMKKEQIDQNEQEVLKNWLESVYSHDRSTLNHFEHNLEVWRQLWRVCEMSEILVVVVDVRHPLIHFPRSLYDYVTGSLRKPMVVVFNKVRHWQHHRGLPHALLTLFSKLTRPPFDWSG
jgi:hypothetical protein